MSDVNKSNINANRYKSKSRTYCSNCGKYGHPYKGCNYPITSFGVIDILITTDDTKIIDGVINKLSINVDTEGLSSRESLTVDTKGAGGIRYNGPNDIKTFCIYKDNIRFLLIRRKHTLGFMEFLRGRYNVDNVDGIAFLFKQMTKEEIDIISKSSFDEIWEGAWENCKKRSRYKNEYNDSKQKFEILKNADVNTNKVLKINKDGVHILNLKFYTTNVTPTWKNAEWGFPKGRRNYHESDIMCAIREFQEESGFSDGEYVVMDKITAIKENLIGTNGVNYRHIYYPALSVSNRIPTVSPENMSQCNEIGDIGWFTYDEALRLIRPYHTERKKILTELYMYIMNTVSDIRNDM